jgi:hypothetical protein
VTTLTKLRGLLIPALTVAWLVCGCGADSPGKKDPGPPTKLTHQRLHAPGELRLTSAGVKPRVRLRYRLEPGQFQGFRTRVNIKHQAAGQTSSLTALLDWERQVTNVAAGWAQAEVSVRKVRLARPPSIREDVVRRLKALKLHISIDARGRARGADKGSGLGTPLTKGLLKNLTAPLPADAVGDGATWERYEPVNLTLPKTNHPVRVGVRTLYTLTLVKRGGRERFALITSRIQLTARSTASRTSGQRITGGGQGSGELKLDLKNASVVSAKSKITVELNLLEKGRLRTLKQTTTSSTRAIKLRPRPQRPRPTGSNPHPYPIPFRPATPG